MEGGDPPIFAAGRVVPNGVDLIRRYCGRPWSGGSGPERWAWYFYDQVPTPRDNRVSAVDVLAAGAIHPGLARSDFEFFAYYADELATWLSVLDPGLHLRKADDAVLAHLDSAVRFEPDVSLTLLSKVLHRKRPKLIPLIGGRTMAWYGLYYPTAAWPVLLRAMRDDTADETLLEAAIALHAIEKIPRPDLIEGGEWISPLRMIDIAVWMQNR